MKTHFTEVLARESVRLEAVTDTTMLATWRRGLVDEVMDPHSPYAKALRQTSHVGERAEFLDRWRELITAAVSRLQSRATAHASRPCTAESCATAERATALILAALHGGSLLSQVAQDPGPLNAALDLALAPLLGPIASSSREISGEPADQ